MKQIQMNWDIDLYRIPCELIDIMMRIPQTRSLKLTKSHIYPNGTYEQMVYFRNPSETTKAFFEGQGCKLQGTMLQSVDSNQFTIFIGYPETVTEIVLTNRQAVFNMSHKINHMSFGNPAICKEKLR